MLLRRITQLAVLLGVPLLGVVYSYNFIGREQSTLVIPFKPFKPKLFASFELYDSTLANKKQVNIDTMLSNVTVVNFWASWCPPCVEEFPAMIELKRRLEGKGVRFLFVSVDEKPEDAIRFLRQNQIFVSNEEMLWDPDKSLALAWGSTKFPETYVIRKDGWVVEKIIGLQQWTRPAVIEYFEGLGSKFSKL